MLHTFAPILGQPTRMTCRYALATAFALLVFLAPGQTWAQTTFYTFNGASTTDWSDPNRWTTDPGGAGFPGSGVPAGGPGGGGGGGSATDRVVIRAGATAVVNFNNLQVAEIELQSGATLDLVATNGHDLGSVSGTGTLRLEPTTASGGTNYELPVGNWASFFSDNGGTLDFSGGGGNIFTSPITESTEVSMNNTGGTITTTTLNNFNTFNNVILSGSGQKTFPADRFKFRGDFRIEESAAAGVAGDYRFRVEGDFVNASTATVAFDGHTNLTTAANYSESAPLDENQIYLKGDLINQGNGGSRLEFTPKMAQANNIPPATVLLFDNNFSDQDFTANGEIRIERFVINKGTDQTFVLNCTADGPNQFNLYGKNNNGPDYGQNDDERPFGLALHTGTVSIGPNIVFEIGNSGYVTSEDARFLSNGGRITQGAGGGGGWVNWGTMECNNGGEIDIGDRRMVIRVPGVFILNDGTVSAGSFRTATAGGIHEGAYIQNGGLLDLEGGAPSNGRSRFILEYASNTFQMTGGTIRIANDNLRAEGGGLDRGIDIRANSSNVSVTGGRLLIDMIDNTSDAVVINSTAPFYDVELQGNGTGDNVVLQKITGPTPGGSATPAPQPLVVLNDFIVGDGVSFDAQNLDLTIGGDLRLGNNVNFQTGTQTTTFNGTGADTLELQSATFNYGLQFHNLTVDKAPGQLVFKSASRTTVPGNAGSLFATVNNELRVENGLLDYEGFRIQSEGDVFLGGDLGEPTDAGRLQFDVFTFTPYEIEAEFNAEPVIGHLEIENGIQVTLLGDDLGEIGTLTMPGTIGIFNIGSFRAPVSQTLDNGGNAWAVDKSVRISGNFSDKGLGQRIDANGTYFYPISTDANGTNRFTPVTATISNFAAADTGYLDFSVVDQEHPSLNAAAPAGSALEYFFRARISGFGGTLPQAVYDFEYDDSDEPSVSPSWVPGKIVGSNRVFEDPADYDATEDTIQFDAGGSFPLETGDYTAGDSANFNGGVDVFYSRYSGTIGSPLSGQPDDACCGSGQAWNENTTWSFIDHNNTPVPTGEFPQEGDIVYIAPGHRIYAGDDATPDPNDEVFNSTSTPIFASTVHLGGTLFFRGDNALQNSVIQEIVDTTGTGILSLENDGNSPTDVPDTDIGDYAGNSNNIVRYRWVNTAADGTHNIPSDFRTYPDLRFFGAGGRNGEGLWDGLGSSGRDRKYILPDVDITVNGNMKITTGVLVEMNTSSPTEGDILIRKDFITGIGNGFRNTGMLQFPANGDSRNVDILGDIKINYAGISGEPAGIRVLSGGSAIEHTIRVQGDINMGDPALDSEFAILDFNETAKINLILDGDSSGTYRRQSTSGSVNLPNFFRINVDKSTALADTFHFNDNFNLDGSMQDAASSSDKNFVITRGVAHLNDPAIDLTLSSGGGDFLINKESGLHLSNGATARVNDAGTGAANLQLVGSLLLDNPSGGASTTELLLQSGGANISTDLIYSPSPTASITVLDDAFLQVGGQIRREAIPPVGGLSYIQGGNSIVELGNEITTNNNTFVTNRGVLDLVGGPGSNFDMSGGTLRVLREIPNASVAEVLLQTNAFSMTGGTVELGETGGGMPAGQTITVDASAGNELFNLTVVDAGVNLTGNVVVNPLTINGDLSILGANSTFSPKNLDINIRGNFLNEGTYDVTTNTTTFDGGAAQTVTLNASTSFANLVVDNPGNTVSMAGSETGTIVNEDLSVLNGTLDLTDKTMELRGDATNNAVVTNSSGRLLLNNGAGQVQTLFGNGSGQYGNLEVDNPGSALLDAAARVNGDLTLTDGNFIASFNELILGPASSVVNFGPTRYIQTEGTNSSAGITKIINGTGSFNLPVGTVLRYAPATYNVTGLNTGGELTLRPLSGPPSAYTDPANNWGVDFHWQVETGAGLDITGLTHTYQYDDADLQTPAQESDPDWQAGYIFSGANAWVKVPSGNVNTTTNVATFNNNSSSNLAAIYAVGRDTELDAIQEFWSDGNGTTDDYFDPASWSTVPPSNGTYPSNPSNQTPDPELAPTGGAGIVHIRTGDVIRMDQQNMEAFEMEIEAGGTLDMEAEIGANFGDILGGGRIIMRPGGSNANLPSGNWTQFVADGGTHEFAGTGVNYDLPAPAQIVEYANVEVSGTGQRIASANDIRVLNSLTLDGPEFVINGSNRFFLGGDFTRLAGSITPNNSTLELDGASDQTFTGMFTDGMNASLQNLELAKSGGDLVIDASSALQVNGQLTWSANALIQSDASRPFRFGQTATYTGGGPGRFVNGPAEKVFTTGGQFTFPVGKSGASPDEYRPTRAFNVKNFSGTEIITAEFFPSTLQGSSGPPPPVTDLEANAHWRYDANTGVTARFNHFWSSQIDPFTAPAHVMKSDDPGTMNIMEDMGGTNQIGDISTAGDIKSVQAHTFASPIFTAIGHEDGAPLPIELMSFDGKLASGDALLNWRTASESNTLLFEVQRSTDAQDFESIGAVAAAGFSSQVIGYDFTDRSVPDVPRVFYRLKQVDADGSFTYSNLVELQPAQATTSEDETFWRVGPNPTRGPGFRIFSLVPEAEEATAVLMGMDGRRILVASGHVQELSDAIAERLQDLPAAIYNLRLVGRGQSEHFKVMKR